MTKAESFTHRFLPAYGAIIACTFPIAVAAAAFDLEPARHPFKFGAFLVFALVLSAALVSLWTRMKVTVSPDGLLCPSDFFTATCPLARWEEWVDPAWTIGETDETKGLLFSLPLAIPSVSSLCAPVTERVKDVLQRISRMDGCLSCARTI